ncbi:chorismate synthase [Bacteroidetes bacterium endosymbiont of Geopemphigus sp.]|uniref:chorismate synthase n=1 Tax=Bacteroidetes bacterium endosymbiont of Geopemphigus sp. TaxID=2047937 RepID=UPI000CD2E391|nr:chorismate synthase [Bacteroidetes bacterium endosymbiont of Geopemphigus sp.]
MAGNTFGKLFKLTSFGESHGAAIGGIIEGCPAGIALDFQEIQCELDRRRPGQSNIVTQRRELDQVYFLSGIFKGITTGTPIGFAIYNEDQKSQDYQHINNSYRPSHADFTYEKKYGIRDHRGGGRSSARETAARVVGGAIARQILSEIRINAFVSSVGPIKLSKSYEELDLCHIEDTPVRCPDVKTAAEMIDLIRKVRKEGDTLGGTVSCIVQNVPIGLGEPVFDKLHADLGKAMLSINAVKGFEYGSGFSGTQMRGSTHNDLFQKGGNTTTNFSGGIQGGISNGMDIYFRVAFKPVATIMREQNTIDHHNRSVSIRGKGRHDPCVVPRAVPIVEAMAALVLADHWLFQKISRN